MYAIASLHTELFPDAFNTAYGLYLYVWSCVPSSISPCPMRRWALDNFSMIATLPHYDRRAYVACKMIRDTLTI